MSGLQELEASLRAGTLEEFLATQAFPLVRGGEVTFVYRGQAEAVLLRHWIHGLASAQAFTRLAPDVWALALELPRGSRVEYKLELVDGADHRLVQDPLNKHLAHDPFGSNSVVHAEGYVLPDWALPDPEAREGTLEELQFRSGVFGETRQIGVYLPARFRRSRRYPLLLVHDGPDYLRFSSLKIVLDNLIHRLDIQGLVVALLEPHERLREYADDERHARHLADELVPMLEARYPLVGTPAARGLMGASFGAVAALSAAWRRQGVFGNLLLQSGSFAFTDIGAHDRGEPWDPVVGFVNALRREPGRPAERIYLSCGTYESLIYYNRSLVPLLQSTGVSLRFTEARDGHNWENWRDRLREGLSFLFPGPLWMVYE